MFEKKRGKRFLASVMALVMLLSLAPVGALAADEAPTTEECSAMPLPAVEDENQQTVADEDNNTPTPQPAVDPKPVVDTSENGETTNSDTENGVANLPLLDENRPVVDTSSTTEEEPTVDVGDVLYDLYDFNGRQPGGDGGYVWNTYTVTYNANLPNGASLISGVSTPDAQTVSTWGGAFGLKI